MNRLPEVSRLEALKKKGEEPDLPPLLAGSHMVTYLFEVGPTMYGAASPAPITYHEMHHWRLETGVQLDCWEARTLRRLSIDYVAELQLASDPMRQAPYSNSDAVPDVAAVAQSMRAALKHLAET